MGLFDVLGGGKGPTEASFGSQLKQTAEAGAQRKRRLFTGARKEVAPLAGQFKGQVGEAVGQAASRRRALAGDFLQQLGAGGRAKDTAQFNQAKQKILGSIPELQRAAREGAAATGGLKRGAATLATQQPVQAAGEALGQVAGDISIQSQERQNQAFSQIFQGDQAFELNRLGIDENVARTLLETGRADILQEALSLAGVEDQLSTDLLGIEQNRQEAAAARDAAAAQRRSSLIGSLIGVGGTIAGGVVGGPAGAAVGGGLAKTAVQPRGR